MKKYQIISYDQASKSFPELRFGYEDHQGSLLHEDEHQETDDEWIFGNEEIPILSILNIKVDENQEDREDEEKESRDPQSYSTSGHYTEFRNRSEHVLIIRPAEEDLETMKEIETMEELEDQDLLPIKLKDETIILPNRIYQFLKDVNIVFTTHFHYDDYNVDHYSTKFYFITDHCEVLDIEMVKKKKHFEITMSYISQKSFVIDFLKDDPSTFQTIRNQKEFGAMTTRNTKPPHQSYVRYFCKVFEKQISQIDEIGKFSLENGIDISNLTEELLPQTTSFMNQTYLNEMDQVLTRKDDEIETLKKEVERLKTHIQYMPDGEMFLETQKHFDSLSNLKDIIK